MPEDTVFDLRRITTVISPRGRVHVCRYLTEGQSTMCNINLLDGHHPDWGENLDDKQPDCRPCVKGAMLSPLTYPRVSKSEQDEWHRQIMRAQARSRVS